MTMFCVPPKDLTCFICLFLKCFIDYRSSQSRHWILLHTCMQAHMQTCMRTCEQWTCAHANNRKVFVRATQMATQATKLLLSRVLSMSKKELNEMGNLKSNVIDIQRAFEISLGVNGKLNWCRNLSLMSIVSGIIGRITEACLVLRNAVNLNELSVFLVITYYMFNAFTPKQQGNQRICPKNSQPQ